MFDLYPHKESPIASAANLAYALVECKFSGKTPSEVFSAPEHLEKYQLLAAVWPRIPLELTAGFERALERYRDRSARNLRSHLEPSELAEEVCAWALAIVHYARAVLPVVSRRVGGDSIHSGVMSLSTARAAAPDAAGAKPK